ncbi:MAG: peptidoglycan-binding protein [Byssovorax sp.]
MSTRPYVVRQGDYTGRLAARFGTDADTLWSDPQNRELADQRPDRDVLAPGDILHVPERSPATQALRPHRTNRYQATVPRTNLSLVMRSAGQPIRNERCAVHGITRDPIEASTDGDGRLALQIPVHVGEITVVIPGRNISCPVRIGHLDPLTEWSGIRSRLTQLGYLRRVGADEGHEAPRPLVAVALRRFQEDQGLPPTGEPDETTRDRLRRAHGS